MTHSHGKTDNVRTTVRFTVTDRIGALDEVLREIKTHGISLQRIESRPSLTSENEYEFFVEYSASPASTESLIKGVTSVVKTVAVVNANAEIPWYPRKIQDLDEFNEKVLSYGSELDADHPGFTDATYRERRQEITKIAQTYKTGSPIPRIEYTKEEIETWGIIFRELTSFFPTHACREQNYIFPLLIQNCGYSETNIPQLEDISKFLKECTGFTLRPVMGLLTSRDFLNGLAFRVFHSTQYIRHHSKPLYTPEPSGSNLIKERKRKKEEEEEEEEEEGKEGRKRREEKRRRRNEEKRAEAKNSNDVLTFLLLVFLSPSSQSDVCHELLGHVPLFADPEFAEFSQEIGLASLGASDEDIEKLATIYWFTVEFGLCKQDNEIKAYGAGLLSSFGELEHCLSDKPEKRPFDPFKACEQKYPITTYQPVYFVAESFRDAKEKVRAYAATLKRPFSLIYNPYTQRIETLDKKEKLTRFASKITSDMEILTNAISNLQ